MRLASCVAIVIILSWSALTIMQIWLESVAWSTYWKITVTMILVGGGLAFAALITREYLSEERMKKDKFID